MKSLVVWHNVKKDFYYYKIVHNTFNYYYLGKTNSYGHKVVLVISITTFKVKYNFFTRFKRNVYRRIITTLENKLKSL